MKKTLLIIGFVWPEPTSSAAGVRMMQLIEFFLSENFEITFASSCAKSNNAVDLDTYNVKAVSIRLNDSSFDTFIKSLNPDIVLFDRFMSEEQFGWRVQINLPNAIRILDTEDLHFLRKAREKAYLKNHKPNNDELSDIAKRELASIIRSDLSLIISKVELEILKKDYGIIDSILFYLPFMVSKISEKPHLPNYYERKDFITIGNFRHPPNLDGVRYLKDEIWPKLASKIPEAQLHVYGAYPTQQVMNYHNKSQRFFIKGWANDVNEVMQRAKVCLAPLRFGAGLKGKVLDAFKNGTPCIMTEIAAEGIIDNNDYQDFKETDIDQFVNAAVKIYNSHNDWQEAQLAGFRIINTKFNITIHTARFKSRIYDLIEQIRDYRAKNIMGQILNHHTLKSTEYMARWIEEKNKPNNL